MLVYETPEPITATVKIAAGDIKFTVSDRAETTVDVRPRRPRSNVDVKAAEDTEVEFTGGRLTVKGPRATRLFGRVPAARPADQQATEPVPVMEAERLADPPVPPVPALTIDALGRKCPIPIIMLADQIRNVPLGAVVAVLADDPAAYTDIPSWCVMKAHEFAGHRELPEGGWALYICRRL